jgi:hypothetical protein
VYLAPLVDAGEGVAMGEPAAAAAAAAERASRAGPGDSHWHAGRQFFEITPKVTKTITIFDFEFSSRDDDAASVSKD